MELAIVDIRIPDARTALDYRRDMRGFLVPLVLIGSTARADDAPPPTGLYVGDKLEHDAVNMDGERCRLEYIRHLSLTLDGAADRWEGHFRFEAKCPTHTTITNCWTKAAASIAPGSKRWKMTSTVTGRSYVPPPPGDLVDWQCGDAVVVLPKGKKLTNGCRILGPHEEPSDDALAAQLCAASPTDFPELDQAELVATKSGLAVRITGADGKLHPFALKRVGDTAEPKPATETAAPFYCFRSGTKEPCARTSEHCREMQITLMGARCEPAQTAYCFSVLDRPDIGAICSHTKEACTKEHDELIARGKAADQVAECAETK